MRKPTLPAVLNAIYAAAADPDHWSAALEAVADAVGGDGALMVRHDRPRASELPQAVMITARLRDDLTGLYLTRHAVNPIALAMNGVRPGRPVSCASLVGPAALRRTALHADILAPQRIAEVISVAHPALTNRGISGGFSVTLTQPRTDDGATVMRRMDRLVPHLSRALDLSLRLAAEDSGRRDLAVALDLMPGAALLLDRAGRVCHANHAAEALLRQRDGLRTEADGTVRLTAALPAENVALGGAITRALALAAGEEVAPGPPLRLSRPSGRPPLVVLTVGLPPDPFETWAGSRGARALVLVADPAAPPPRGAALALTGALGLTPAEAAVAALVASGAGLPAAAASLGIAPSTAKTHLSRVFDKAEIRSQAELVRLMSALPAASTSRRS